MMNEKKLIVVKLIGTALLVVALIVMMGQCARDLENMTDDEKSQLFYGNEVKYCKSKGETFKESYHIGKMKIVECDQNTYEFETEDSDIVYVYNINE